MKRCFLLIGALSFSLSSINASGILGTKPQTTAPPKKAPASSKNLHPYTRDLENYKGGPNFGITVNYLGGAYGPTNMPIATTGVPATASDVPPKGSAVNVGLNWSNGVNLNAFFSQDISDGPLFFLSYRYILGTNQRKGFFLPYSKNPPMISTFPINIEWGESARVYGAHGKYNNFGAQTGAFLVGRSLLQKGSTSLFIASGLSIDYIDHDFTIKYNYNDPISIDSGLYTITQTEHKISGGPEIRLIARKSFGRFFGIDTTLSSYGHLAYYGNQGQETYKNETTPKTYLYGTHSSLIRAIPGIEVSFGGYYTYTIKDAGTLTFNAAWDGGFEPSGTLLTSPSVGTSAFRPNLMGYSMLRVGGTYAF